MIATTGHSWDQVRNDWDLPRLVAWSLYCRDHPTLRAMVQAYLGISTQPKVEQQAQSGTPDELLAMLAVFPGATEIKG